MVFSRAPRTLYYPRSGQGHPAHRRRRFSGIPCFYFLFSSLKGFFHILYSLSGHNMHPVHPGRHLHWRVQKSLKGGNSKKSIREDIRIFEFFEFFEAETFPDLSAGAVLKLIQQRVQRSVLKDIRCLTEKIPLKEFFHIFSLEHPGERIYRRVSIHVFLKKHGNCVKKCKKM